MSSSNGGSDTGYSSGEENEAKAKSEEDRPSKRQKVLPLQAIILKENMLNHESIAKAKKVYAASHQRNGSPDNIADMYCEFMTIKIMKGDYDPENAKLSPGGIVDEFWHAHCLDTAGYPKFFKDVNAPSGEAVHHDALKSQDADDLIEKREENTRKAYKEIFEKECPFLIVNRYQTVAVGNGLEVVVHNGFQIFIKAMDGRTYDVTIGASNTVDQLKSFLRAHPRLGTPADQQRLVFAGKQIEDGRTMSDYNIIEGSTVYMILKLRGC